MIEKGSTGGTFFAKIDLISLSIYNIQSYKFKDMEVFMNKFFSATKKKLYTLSVVASTYIAAKLSRLSIMCNGTTTSNTNSDVLYADASTNFLSGLTNTYIHWAPVIIIATGIIWALSSGQKKDIVLNVLKGEFVVLVICLVPSSISTIANFFAGFFN